MDVRTTNIKLKPCPFCGSSDIEYCQTNDRANWFECEDCGAQQSSQDTERLAALSWNERQLYVQQQKD